MSDTKESNKTFVLEEYNNVSVATSDLPKDTVKDLTKDELKEWAPFKVSTAPLPAFANSTDMTFAELDHHPHTLPRPPDQRLPPRSQRPLQAP